MLKKLTLLLAVSAMFSVLSVFGQKEKNEEDPAPKQETRVERPVESPKEQPRPEPPRESPKESPRETPRESPKESPRESPRENPRSEPKQVDNSPRERPSNPPNNEERRRTNPKDRNPDDLESPSPNRRPKDNDDNGTRPKKPERPPVNNPNPPINNPPVVNPNPPTLDNSKNKDKDKDKDRDDRRRNRNGGWGGNYPTSSPTVINNPSANFSIRDYFDKDDVFFDVYDSFVDKPENYLPFFDDSPNFAFKPLYYSYVRKFFRNEFPWVADNWTIYYEPDLDDIYVDFTTLGNVKYERMVFYATGETIKKVNKKFKYKGNELRPVLVEKIPDIEQDKVYSFNVHDLPKGDYELRLIAKDGSTVKHSIRIK